jgi:ureidoacrylate peracid hydrolase
LLRRVDDADRYEKGYNVATLTDCTATVSEEEQRLSVEKNYPMFSRPLTHTEFLSELSKKPAK